MAAVRPPGCPRQPALATGSRADSLRRFLRPGSRFLAAALVHVLFAGCSPRGCVAQAPGGASAVTVPPRSTEFSGRVVRVRDGDSLVVLGEGAPVEVRLDGVDAPELVQAFGGRAKRCVAELAFGKPVRLEIRGRDKYDRELAEVFLADGRSLNRELVSAGCAWWFRRYSTDRDLEARELQARTERRGLWADPDPVPPWDFREEHPRAPDR